MQDWCYQAGLYHCPAHGLRKAGATIAADDGATAHRSWRSSDGTQAGGKIYASADQNRLAAGSMHMIELVPPENEVGLLSENTQQDQAQKMRMVLRGGIEPPT